MASLERSSSGRSALTVHETTEADLDTKHRNGAGAVAEAHPAAAGSMTVPAYVEKAAGLAAEKNISTDEDDLNDDEKDPYPDVPADQRGTAGLRRPWSVSCLTEPNV